MRKGGLEKQRLLNPDSDMLKHRQEPPFVLCLVIKTVGV